MALVDGERVLGAAWLDDLLVLELDAPEAALPRSNAARGWPLHISLLFRNELKEELTRHAVSLHDRWSGRAVVLQVEWVGRGGPRCCSRPTVSPPTQT